MRGDWKSRLIGSERRVHSLWNIGPYNLKEGPNVRLYVLDPLKTNLHALAVIPLKQILRQEKRKDQGFIGGDESISRTIHSRLAEVAFSGPSKVRQTVVDEILYTACMHMVTTETWSSARATKSDLTPMHFLVLIYPKKDCISLSQTIVWDSCLTLDQARLSDASRSLIAHDRSFNPHFFEDTNVLRINFKHK